MCTFWNKNYLELSNFKEVLPTKNNLPGQWKIVNEISDKYLYTYRKPQQLIVLDSK